MSKQSEEALALISHGQLGSASRMALAAVLKDPADWHTHYAIGQCYRYSKEFPQACVALARANELGPRRPPVLLALAIARQLNGEYVASVDAIRLVFEIDLNYAPAYNTLAMTQRLMGDFEKSAHNYDAGAKALSRSIVQSMLNAENNPRLPHRWSRADLWSEYAFGGAIHLAGQASIERLAWPTGEIAEHDAKTQEYRGWYWQDSADAQGEVVRLFLPNYFNTFFARLRAEPIYANLMGNRSTVLRLIGKVDDADRCLMEAEDFDAYN